MVGFGFLEKRRNTTWFLGVLLIGCIFISTTVSRNPQPPEKQQCTTEEYRTENGTCCNKCPAGYKLGGECTADGARTKCLPCPKDQYSEHSNYRLTCSSCRRCRAEEYEFSKCKPNQNTDCRCKNGYFKDPIDSTIYDCLKCSKCGPGERQYGKCTAEHDTQCECEKDFYKLQNKCLPCKPCTEHCTEQPHCPQYTTNPKPMDVGQVLGGGVCVLLVLLVAVGVVTYLVTKRHTKSKMGRGTSKPSMAGPSMAEPSEATQILIHSDEPACGADNRAERPYVLKSEPEHASKLPDCVPREVKIAGLVYDVLGLVPATRVKELARCLGVTDLDIERAEMDHHTCKEAHYQMLRVWAERGSPGGRAGLGGGVLHLPLMQEMLDRLGDMHLGGAVEELEAKFGIVRGQLGAA